MLLMAIRTHQYLKTWGIDTSSHHRFIFGVIQRSLRYGALSTLSKLRNVTGKVPHSSQLSSPLIIWIGLYAFHYTLSRRPTSFKNLIKDLAMVMRSSQYRAIRKALGPFLKQHSHDLDFIQW
ncbi:hypothetical protein DL93DRAFT_2075166 [Clavulina sp. PMI_390]|nr:hypothetical protein DL93DRAFT_2075166 [Clavulina sp. PMI_390]